MNVGLPREVAWLGRTVRTAIFKSPVEGRRRRRLGPGHLGGGDGPAEPGVAGRVAGQHEQVLTGTQAGLREEGVDAHGVVCDVRKLDDVERLADEAFRLLGAVHVVFNNAGIGAPGVPLEDLTYAQWKAVVDVNLTGAFLCTQEAFKLAADPTIFPEQLTWGLRPWQPLKLYMGGVRPNEDWTIRLDTGEYDPVLGDSFQSIARLGLSFQRSQNSGRFICMAR